MMQKTPSLDIRPSHAPLGAEIVGLDLAQPLDEPTFRAIEAAYDTYTVLVFRQQRLAPEHLLQFARRFGPLEVSPRTQFALPGYPEILLLSNIVDEQGRPIGNAEAGLTWHTDLSYTATPPRGSILYAVEVPVSAQGETLGETLFVSTAAAYEALPASMQQRLRGLRAIHRAGAKQYAQGSQLAEAVKDLPDVIHPVIRTHPVTGRRAVYVRAGECVGIVGMPAEEALPLIEELSEFVIRPAFMYRHQWQVGDVLMWDNCCAQHKAIKNYALPQRRLMHRVTVNGSVPV
ncbi:MAG: TauD/TfdA dioxygenase family protein [Candidatus Tectimicrobiota bacterium]